LGEGFVGLRSFEGFMVKGPVEGLLQVHGAPARLQNAGVELGLGLGFEDSGVFRVLGCFGFFWDYLGFFGIFKGPFVEELLFQGFLWF
jgi:hypothetical protein